MTSSARREPSEEPSNEPAAARYESLIRVAEAIRSQGTRRDLFRVLAEELREVISFDAMAYYDAPNDVKWHICEQCQEPSQVAHSAVPKEETAAWWVYQNQRPLVIPCVDRHTRPAPSLAQFKALRLQSVCALPLTTPSRRLGSLVLASARENAYSPDEVRFLALVANQIAMAAGNALDAEENQRSRERLKLLLDLTNRVVLNLDLRDLLREVSAAIRQMMHCDGAGIALPDPEGQLRIYALDFPTSKGIIREGVLLADPVSSVVEVFRTGQVRNLTLEAIGREPPSAAEGARSICRLPLISRSGVLGVLSLGSSKENAFAEEDIQFLGQAANQIAIAVENANVYGEIAALKDRLARENVYLEDEIRTELNFEQIVGASEGLRRVLREVETVAPTSSTVLICGETGTGKELIARAVHNLSARKAHAFVKLNCAAIPTGLLESELFGHEKGAFTGAIAQRIGRFELAHQGTIFLDEIGEIPLELQPKLLRVLQEREFERLGSAQTRRTDARLIAATNRDLEAMVGQGLFRSDLYYRLNVFPIRIPALRERPEDIPVLVRHFTQQFSRRNNRNIDTIPSETMEAMTRYDWPGNIRELQNVIERAVIVTHGPVLRVPAADLRPRNGGRATTGGETSPSQPLRRVLDEEERRQIVSALERASWVVSGPKGAAAILGVKRSTLQFRMKRLGIPLSRRGR